MRWVCIFSLRMFPFEKKFLFLQAMFEGDTTVYNNPMMKSAMCYLQGNTNFKDIVTSLPHDVQVLILLCIGTQNMTSKIQDKMNYIKEH
jgi:hypothetical protein